MSPFLIDKACSSGLIEKLDLKLLPSADKYLPDSLHECGVKAALAAQIIAFNADKFPKDKQPSKLEHFWDVQNYPGKRGLRGRPNQTLEYALVADGVAPDQIYKVLGTEAGLQRAFKKLDSIKKNLHWWDSFAEPPQLLVAGEVTMSYGSDGRFAFAVKEGKPLKMIWEGAAESGNFWSIVKGSPNKDLTMKYVVFTQRHDIQVRQPEILGYAGPLKSVVAATPPEVSKTLITHPGNRVRVWFEDAVFWTDNLDEYTKRFKKWQAE